MDIEKIKIEKGSSIDVKRFYLPGVEITTKCPKCGEEIKYFGEDYLSYPIVGEIETLALYCSNCDINFLIDAKLNIELEYDLDSLRKE